MVRVVAGRGEGVWGAVVVVRVRAPFQPGVASLTYPPSSIPPGIINLGPTYRGYIQPRFNIPPGVYGT